MPTDTKTVKQHIEDQLMVLGIDPSAQISDICTKIDEYLTSKGQKSFDDYAKFDTSVKSHDIDLKQTVSKQSSRKLLMKKLILLSILSYNLEKNARFLALNNNNNTKRFYTSIKRRKR